MAPCTMSLQSWKQQRTMAEAVDHKYSSKELSENTCLVSVEKQLR